MIGYISFKIERCHFKPRSVTTGYLTAFWAAWGTHDQASQTNKIINPTTTKRQPDIILMRLTAPGARSAWPI